MSKKKLSFTEGEVQQMLRLFAARRLIDDVGLDVEEAMLFVIDHEEELVEAMEEAVVRYGEANAKSGGEQEPI